MMNLFASVWAHSEHPTFSVQHQMIAWPKIKNLFLPSVPVHLAFLPSGCRVWIRTCLPGILSLCFSNQCLNTFAFALLSSSPQPGTSPCFLSGPLPGKSKHTCPQLHWPLWYFNFFFIGSLHACWLPLQLRSRNFHVVLGERVSPSQSLPQPGAGSCRNSLAALGNRSVWNNIVSLRSGEKNVLLYSHAYTLKKNSTKLGLFPPIHSPPTLPFS